MRFQMSEPVDPSEILVKSEPSTPSAVDAPSSSDTTETAEAGGEVLKSARKIPWFWLSVAVLFCAELYVFGHDGELSACVGKEGTHDFSLIGGEHDESQRWALPYCQSGENLGMVSHREELAARARNISCQQAAALQFPEEEESCRNSQDGWKLQYRGKQIYPWSARFVKRFFGGIFGD